MSNFLHTSGSWWLLVPPLAALAVAAVAARDGGVRPARTLRAVRFASPLMGGAALLAALAAALGRGAPTPVAGIESLGLVLRLDPLSAILTVLVTFVAVVVLRYSRNALDGDPRHGRFLGELARTVACVLLVVAAGDLVLLTLAWILTGLSLERLLRFHADRPRAATAARQHALFARISDLALCGAVVLLARGAGSTDLAVVLAEARALAAGGSVPPAWGLAAFLICIAAIGKSAQIPAHVWLPRSMESPAPVSALLHAGVVNAGGFLLIRCADVLVLAPGALVLLLAVGGATTLVGAWVTTLQPDRKGRLAWSTVAQMGLMVFQCGLGAFSLAVLHLVAHSLYKAHAFLTAGSGVTRTVHPAPNGTNGGLSPRGWWTAAATTALVLLGVDALAGSLGGTTLASKPGALFLGAILVLGIAPTVARDGATVPRGTARSARGVEGGRTVGTIGLLCALYLLWSSVFHAILAAGLPAPVAPSTAGSVVASATILGLALLSFLPALSARLAHSERWARMEVHLRHGLYLSTLLNRRTAAVARRGGSS